MDYFLLNCFNINNDFHDRNLLCKKQNHVCVGSMVWWLCWDEDGSWHIHQSLPASLNETFFNSNRSIWLSICSVFSNHWKWSKFLNGHFSETFSPNRTRFVSKLLSVSNINCGFAKKNAKQNKIVSRSANGLFVYSPFYLTNQFDRSCTRINSKMIFCYACKIQLNSVRFVHLLYYIVIEFIRKEIIVIRFPIYSEIWCTNRTTNYWFIWIFDQTDIASCCNHFRWI